MFALHLPVAPSTTVAGGARLSEGRTLVRIEPYGLLRFADNSTKPSVSEMFGKVRVSCRLVNIIAEILASHGKQRIEFILFKVIEFL